MSGKLIVIEGLDGSGKATQSALLEQALAARGHRVRKISFPNYDSPSSGPIKMYLGGEFGQNPDDVNAWAASTFYAVDRYAGYKSDWGSFYGQGGGVLIADRYATSNYVHQMSKLEKAEWAGYRSWLEDLEYTKLGILAPDLVLYLDVDFEVSRCLLIERYGSEGALDIHEKDMDHLRRGREAAMWAVHELGWRPIKCDKNGHMRPVSDIAAEILQIVGENL